MDEACLFDELLRETGVSLVAFLCSFEEISALPKKSGCWPIFCAGREAAQKIRVKSLGKWQDYLCRKSPFLCRWGDFLCRPGFLCKASLINQYTSDKAGARAFPRLVKGCELHSLHKELDLLKSCISLRLKTPSCLGLEPNSLNFQVSLVSSLFKKLSRRFFNRRPQHNLVSFGLSQPIQ